MCPGDAVGIGTPGAWVACLRLCRGRAGDRAWAMGRRDVKPADAAGDCAEPVRPAAFGPELPHPFEPLDVGSARADLRVELLAIEDCRHLESATRLDVLAPGESSGVPESGLSLLTGDDASSSASRARRRSASTVTTSSRSQSCRRARLPDLRRRRPTLGSPPIEAIRALGRGHRTFDSNIQREEPPGSPSSRARRRQLNHQSSPTGSNGGLEHDFADDVRLLPQRTMRSLLISLSHRRSLARLASAAR